MYPALAGGFLTTGPPGFPGGSVVKNLPVKLETQVRSLGLEESLEKEMANHFGILAWEVQWREEPDGL